MKTNKEKYNELLQRIKQDESKAEYWEKAGETDLAEHYRQNVKTMKQKADKLQLDVKAGERVEAVLKGNARRSVRQAPRRKTTAGKPRTQGTPNRSGRKLTADEIIAGLFKGVEKATGKNFATDTIQHVTTPDECREWLKTVKAMHTDKEGKLDKKGYCNALNNVRDNMLFTIQELKKAIEDARRSGEEKAIPGYETLINQYETNAGIIADEIKANGGKVN